MVPNNLTPDPLDVTTKRRQIGAGTCGIRRMKLEEREKVTYEGRGESGARLGVRFPHMYATVDWMLFNVVAATYSWAGPVTYHYLQASRVD